MSNADRVVDALNEHPELRDAVKEKLNAPDPNWKPDHEGLATLKGREYAVRCLIWRRANPPTKINNSSLYAGSPMYFYCRSCDHVSDILPESYTSPPGRICGECSALQGLGWLE